MKIVAIGPIELGIAAFEVSTHRNPSAIVKIGSTDETSAIQPVSIHTYWNCCIKKAASRVTMKCNEIGNVETIEASAAKRTAPTRLITCPAPTWYPAYKTADSGTNTPPSSTFSGLMLRSCTKPSAMPA